MIWSLSTLLFCTFLLGAFLIATDRIVSVDPAYDAIFEDTGIVHYPPVFGPKTAHYAMKDAQGILYCADYRFRDDVVSQWMETTYIPVSEYTYTQKEALEQAIKERYQQEAALPFCSIDYEMGRKYFTVTCTFSQVDKPENYSMLYEAKLLEKNAFISMSVTEKALLKQGFIKR